MINELKKVLLRPFNVQLDEYREYKAKFDSLQEEIMYDSCEKDYQAKKTSLKNEFKSNKNKEYYDEKSKEIMAEYKKNLDHFNEKLEEYNTMKARLASWNVYELQRQMEKINSATTLEELGLNLDQAKEMCAENGIEFRIDLEQM